MNITFRTPWSRVTTDSACPVCDSGSQNLFAVQTGDGSVWVTCDGCTWESRSYTHIGPEPTPFTVFFNAEDIEFGDDGTVMVDGTVMDATESYA